MNTSNTDKIKIVLLTIIALTLIIQTFLQFQTNNGAVAQAGMNSSSAPNSFEAPIPEPERVPEGPSTTIKFAETEHNFGKIKQESTNTKVFTFTNTGNEPLTILNAVGSCGCTVPTYSKEPIAPGKTGEITVDYKPGQQKGTQTKTVTITANTEPQTTMLMIHADVQEIK